MLWIPAAIIRPISYFRNKPQTGVQHPRWLAVILCGVLLFLTTFTVSANQCTGATTVFTAPVDRKITNPAWCWTYATQNDVAYRHFYGREANQAGCLSENGLYRVRCNEPGYVLGPAYYCPSVTLGEIQVATRSTGSSDGYNPDGCYLDYSGYQQLTRCNEYYPAGPRWSCETDWKIANTDSDGNVTRCYRCASFDPEKNLGGGNDSSCQDNSQYVGNPVNSGTGNKYQSETDYSGVSAFPFELTRYYNSQANTSGIFGANWSAFSTIRVADANNLTLIRPDLRAINYSLADSVWITDADITHTLISISGGYLCSP